MRAYNTFFSEGNFKAKFYENIEHMQSRIQKIGLLGGAVIEVVSTPLIGLIALIEAVVITIFNFLGTLFLNKSCARDLFSSLGALTFSCFYLAFSPVIGLINGVTIAKGLYYPPTDDEESYIQKLIGEYEKRNSENSTWRKLQKDGLAGGCCNFIKPTPPTPSEDDFGYEFEDHDFKN